MKLRMAGLLVLGLLWAAGLTAQEPGATQPLREADFIRLVNEMAGENISLEEVVTQVRARGIAFDLTPELEEGLKKLKGGDVLLNVLTEPATVELHANVPGAEVAVDGEKRDPVTPEGQVALAGLAPGRHLIRLKAEGYVGERLDVFLKPGETRRVEVELKPAVVALPGPLGVRVNVQAGTPEDTALAELEFVQEAKDRLERLQGLVDRYGDSPLALLVYGLLQETHLVEEQFDNAIATGEEILRRDPRSFPARVRQSLAYLGKGELEAAFDFAAQARELVEGLGVEPAPEGAAPDAWEREKQKLLEGAEGELKRLDYALFVAASRVPEAARRSVFVERFLKLFPQSDYRGLAYVNLAFTHQQQGDAAKALEWGGRALEANPDEPSMLMLVADVLSERGENLEGARALATHLLELLDADPDKLRPQGLGDEQWAGQKQLWEGMAHSTLGQVLMHEERAQSPGAMTKTKQASGEFQTAAPLLKAQPYYYARNLYRLGFAYAKLGKLAKARDTLSEVMSLETPWRQAARPVLEQVQQRLKRRGQ